MSHREQILILGGGIAALSAAEAARQADPERPITICAEESHYPYYRLRLSFLLGQSFDKESLLIHPPAWYDERNIVVLTGRRARSIDAERRIVTLESGETIPYGRLVIAVGAAAFLPPLPGTELPGVYTVRQVDDVAAINTDLRPGRRVIVVGGGILGLEAAWTLHEQGIAVTVVEHGPRLLSRQLDAGGSRLLERLAADEGITILTEADSMAIEKGEGVLRLRLADGRTVEGERIIFSTGIRANLELARSAGIAAGRGICVDEWMQTSVPAIFAAGDVAEFKGNLPGLWSVAAEQGKRAGRNAVLPQTDWTPYRPAAPSNMLHVFGIKIFSLGAVSSGVTLGDEEASAKEYKKFFFSDGRLVGAVLMGDLKWANRLKAAMESGRDFSGATGTMEAFLAALADE
ncbi:nad(p)h-nitrite reductase, large subunit protein nirb, putative [Heliomicrobium modesticaldum Ice1]|uniref:Nad(P)h-nitrite reductase, large subunit protein nirb, putative n=1 Tax=Heliobacterium modesticaldum (strain ATCC 51547 / Ice1) TaxID=498761 RepID=B0TFF1_HELMI|nr:FAD-dependent oxidoreductase [Heliomicrobium modesticaldum]ABZ83050.1 nad(p)h-nitrite reductase, large subunit protein nirb, putative [Heliomicrobium modesticaldum Ice1]